MGSKIMYFMFWYALLVYKRIHQIEEGVRENGKNKKNTQMTVQ